VILVVDGKGSSLSVAAQIHGFLTFRPDSRIEGVILNRTSPEMVKRLKPQLEALGISCIGAVPVCEEAKLESRHLGLTIPQEQEALRERLEALGQAGGVAGYFGNSADSQRRAGACGCSEREEGSGYSPGNSGKASEANGSCP